MRPNNASRQRQPPKEWTSKPHVLPPCESLAVKPTPSSPPGVWVCGSTIPAGLCNRGRILVVKNSQGRGVRGWGWGPPENTIRGGGGEGGARDLGGGVEEFFGEGEGGGGQQRLQEGRDPEEYPGAGRTPPPQGPSPPMPPPLRCLPRERVGRPNVEMQPRDVAPAGATPTPPPGGGRHRKGGRGKTICWREPRDILLDWEMNRFK